jgi:hypothetical protein
MPSKDLEEFMWQILKALERSGVVKETQAVTALCDACKTRHPRAWFDRPKTGDGFYLCHATGKAVIEFQTSASNPSGKRSTVDWIDLINQLL